MLCTHGRHQLSLRQITSSGTDAAAFCLEILCQLTSVFCDQVGGKKQSVPRSSQREGLRYAERSALLLGDLTGT